MKLSLADFEQNIDPVILKRGLQYYKKGHVTHFDEMSYGEYEAVVEGTETYTVRLTLRDEQQITEWVCDCPYDMGPVCKHIVAALYYAQREAFATEDEPVGAGPVRSRQESARKVKSATPKTPKTSKTPKRKTIAEQIEETLDTLSHDDLKAYMRELCDRDREFRQLFLAKYAHRTAPASKELYAGQIRAMVDAAAGRQRFIEYSKAGRLGSAVYELVETAQESLRTGNHRTAIFICQAVIEQMIRAMEITDDSDGSIGIVIDAAIDTLLAVADAKPESIRLAKLAGSTDPAKLAEPLRKELFDYALSTYTKGEFSDWSWHWDMMRLAVALAATPHEMVSIRERLSEIKPERDKEWNWRYRQAQRLMAELMRKSGDHAAVRYMEENLDNPDFRAALIERAIAAKDYERATVLADEGVRRDEKSKYGNPDRWRDYLLTVFQRRGDTKNAGILLRHFMTTPNGAQHRPFEYCYRELKKLVPATEWEVYLEGLVREITQKQRLGSYESIAQLYIWESLWDKLFDLLKKDPSLYRVAAAEKYLAARYAGELCDLYRDGILSALKQTADRKRYAEACRYIRHIIKLGHRPKAEALVAELRRLYPARRALIEELEKI